MGGANSGTYCRWDAKSVTIEQKRIDIRWLRKQNCLYSGASGQLSWSSHGEKTGSINFRMEENKMILSYRHRPHGADWEDVKQAIYFDNTPCNYGGHRKWFLCPHCGKRVAILYGARKFFLCRHCCDLTYKSCNASRLQRINDKADKLRKQLGGSVGSMAPIPKRPKGQHRATYNEIVAEIERLEGIVDLAIYNEFRVRL